MQKLHILFNTKTIISFVVAIQIFSLGTAQDSHASIFDGLGSGGSGIFGGLGERVRTIFEGRPVDIGGSTVPFTPNPPSPPGPDDPPAPGSGEFIKVWVEWDTFYRHGQPTEIDPTDPLEAIHREYIEGSAEEPMHGCCATCGEVVENVEHVVYGWCGGDAAMTGGGTRGISVSIESPGPNDDILPAAIPNKMIRRDGYVYECVKHACYYIDGPTPTPDPDPTITPDPPPSIPITERRWNYMEFQTLIYHSNDFIIDLWIENVGDKPMNVNDEIRIYKHTQADREWPHNIDKGTNALGFTTWAGYPARNHEHGDAVEGLRQGAGGVLAPGESRKFMQYSDVGVRNTIPSVPRTFGMVGGNTPRDYNFVCDENDGAESERCGGPHLLLERPLTTEEWQQYFFEFRDVTALGGCGYEASSNNSVIGPEYIEILYGDPNVPERTSRSVAIMSIPIGNPIDDEARPFGWPATGRIAENWGNTGQAQAAGSYRNITGNRSEYDEYLYCPGLGTTYPNDGRQRAGDYLHPGIDIAPATTQVRPQNVYTTHAGWVTFAGYDPNYPDKGYVVQVESDFNRDGIPDAVTRYSHLSPASIQFDVQNMVTPFNPDGRPHQFGTTTYVARNTLIGKMGDSGSPGDTHVQYEIFYPQTVGLNPMPIHGNVGGERCLDDPYILSCLVEGPPYFFFNALRFEPNLVFGPVFVNPT